MLSNIVSYTIEIVYIPSKKLKVRKVREESWSSFGNIPFRS